jgi:predicted amidohydrolase YtcJ
MTLAGAFAAFEETDKGSVEVGKLADITVLSQDILTVAEAVKILQYRGDVMTLVGGEVAYTSRMDSLIRPRWSTSSTLT